jgi:aryl-alcohol dehydrogenase-like predicted oxidoreductase
MQCDDFLSIGKSTSQIGLGCARLVGRRSLRRSAELIETALDLGIRYFDVAPSYGMGTAEEVVGEVLGGSNQVTVATKVGIPRPRYGARADLLRWLAMPILNRQRSLKALATRMYSRSSTVERGSFDFSRRAIRTSLEVSLEKLRRDSVDVFLAHEPEVRDLVPSVDEGFEELVREGLITAFGAGVDSTGDRWTRFGSIWQSRWPDGQIRGYQHDVAYIFHGVVRSAAGSGMEGARASALVRAALARAPNSILLVSASTPGRLKGLLEEVS